MTMTYVCELCGMEDENVKRYQYIDSSGNNDVIFYHDKCNQKEIIIKAQLDIIDGYISDLQSQINKLRRIRRK